MAPAADQELTLVCDEDYPPLSYIDGGVLRGFDTELAEALAVRLGTTITVESAPWTEALERTAIGQADILSGVIKTAGRTSTLAFTIPYLEDNYVIFRRSDLIVKQLPDLQKARLIMLEGDAAIETWVIPNGLATNMRTCRGFSRAFEALELGEADYTIAPRALGLNLVSKRGYRSIQPWGRPLFSSSFALAVGIDKQVLLAELNDAIIALSRDGTLARLEDRWKTGVSITAYDTQRIPSWLPIVLVSLLSVAGLGLFLLFSIRRSLAEHKRRSSTDRDILRAILDTGNDAIWWFDEHAELLGSNARALATPRSLQEEARSQAKQFCARCSDPVFAQGRDEDPDETTECTLLEAGPLVPFPIIVVRHNMSRELLALKTSERELSTELALCHARLREMARYDPNTGLLRRGALIDTLEEQADIARRRADTLKLTMLRIKDLRQLNRRFTHAKVDHMLETISHGIRTLLQEDEYAGTLHTACYVLGTTGHSDDDKEFVVSALRQLVHDAGIPKDHPVQIAAIELSAYNSIGILESLEGAE